MPFIDRCRECPYQGKAIGPRGNPTSRIVLVGEAPGENEVDEGMPFVGRAGTDVLWPALAEAHIDEASIFITNSVSCRPLNPAKPIRTPTRAAIDACQGRLAHDIELNSGAVLVALGAIAVQALTGQRGFPVRNKHGRVLASKWGRVVATLHPASGLHRPADRAMLFAMLVDDLKDARRLAGLGEDAVETRAPNVPNFRLRFRLSEVMYWTARYAYADDAEVEAIGDRARERGWYTREEFLTVARWKSPRSRRRCEENDEAHVKAATQLALSTPDERQRIEALTQLHGIDYPTASVLLHLAHRDPYPIIDYRALWSLGIESPPSAYSFAFWWSYTQACRSLATDAGVRMRTFDRALWQFSKERQAPSGKKVPSPPAETGSATPDVRHNDDGVGATSGVYSPRTPTEGTPMPGTRRYPYRADLHARLIEIAINGSTITYSGLGTSRRMVGSYLYRIAKEEQAAGRPPLTALVVHKVDGKPGPGFLEAAKWVGFWREGETEDGVWRRAVEAVHQYWRPKLTDDLD